MNSAHVHGETEDLQDRYDEEAIAMGGVRGVVLAEGSKGW
jgi:hypothetical protein